MDTTLLQRKFERIGARVKLAEASTRSARNLSIDIGNDRRGEFFELRLRQGYVPMLDVIDVQPRDRHLLLLVREPNAKSKFLCGHDERHWFVAGIPESAPVGTVAQAKSSLQPQSVAHAVAIKGVAGKARNRRRNAAFVRQGEWFFLPHPKMTVEPHLILRHEPLSRGQGSKPHVVDECIRTGGQRVYVCRRHPTGLTENKYRAVLLRNKAAKKWDWTMMVRNPGVYVRGRVRHADHATITLPLAPGRDEHRESVSSHATRHFS